ncbi:MAG: hypothetical protein COA47_01210 [Robiginitomaculum sp.]|nr:MAG: hypothetical protein COA47_01210 [Robiginitomaculum sp.]
MKTPIPYSQLTVIGLALLATACSSSATQPKITAPTIPIAQYNGVALAPPRCEPGAPHAKAPAELAQFDFLIGDFTIEGQAWTAQGWRSSPTPPPPARWNGKYGLDGMAIYDEWFNVDPGLNLDTPRGVNVRFYDEKTSEWKMMWVHTGVGQVQDLRAEMRDGELTMWQEYPDRPDFLATFIREDKDHWHRISFAKDDEGNWTKTIKLAATRLPCAN